ncbi:hypothetical protein UlMin_043761 [Ulmus minor]
MKLMDKAALDCRKKPPRAHTEREKLQSLDHTFLPALYTHFEIEKFSCLVMEFCPGGDLHALRQRQPKYLHMLGIIYRDLKPENVLIREDWHTSNFHLLKSYSEKLPRAQTEREKLQSIDHPFLPTLYTHFEIEKFSCLVMEFFPGGDFHALRQRQPEYFHMLGIIYRDLNLENVLIKEDWHISNFPLMDKAALDCRKKPPRAHTEREKLQSLDHTFLPALYTHFEIEKFSCLVMEFCPSGDLHAHRQRQPSRYFLEHVAKFYEWVVQNATAVVSFFFSYSLHVFYTGFHAKVRL